MNKEKGNGAFQEMREREREIETYQEACECDYVSYNANSVVAKNRRRTRALAVVLSVLFVLISGFIMLCMFAERVYIYTGVEGPSMQPTINANSPNTSEPYDYAYINTYQKGTYGDIIVIKHINSGGEVRYVIKRLIGMAGDTITIDNTDATVTKVYRNGELLVEDYIKAVKFNGIGGTVGARTGVTSVTIPENGIFYMGDNRNNSDDCRNYGYNETPYCETTANIIGRVDYIVPNGVKDDGKDVERLFAGIREIFKSIF